MRRIRQRPPQRNLPIFVGSAVRTGCDSYLTFNIPAHNSVIPAQAGIHAFAGAASGRCGPRPCAHAVLHSYSPLPLPGVGEGPGVRGFFLLPPPSTLLPAPPPPPGTPSPSAPAPIGLPSSNADPTPREDGRSIASTAAHPCPETTAAPGSGQGTPAGAANGWFLLGMRCRGGKLKSAMNTVGNVRSGRRSMHTRRCVVLRLRRSIAPRRRCAAMRPLRRRSETQARTQLRGDGGLHRPAGFARIASPERRAAGADRPALACLHFSRHAGADVHDAPRRRGAALSPSPHPKHGPLVLAWFVPTAMKERRHARCARTGDRQDR
jgi:hypothetical protein